MKIIQIMYNLARESGAENYYFCDIWNQKVFPRPPTHVAKNQLKMKKKILLYINKQHNNNGSQSEDKSRNIKPYHKGRGHMVRGHLGQVMMSFGRTYCRYHGN